MATHPDELQRQHDYFDTFTTEHGKRVLDDLERRGHFRKGTLTVSGGRTDQARTMWAEGRRSMVLEIHDAIEKARQGHGQEQQAKAITTNPEG